jgi:putative ABC transport system substrate-binding protein
MIRREFIALLGGAAAWPLAGLAQQGDRVRRIGWLRAEFGDENDSLWKSFVSVSTRALADLGWIVDRNVQMDFRGTGDDINRLPALAREVVGLQPDIILANGTRPPLPSSGRRGRSRSSLRV